MKGGGGNIRSPKELAEELAYRAQHLKRAALDELAREQTLSETDERPVVALYEFFDKTLARQTAAEFADAYAQTLTYGLLAARWMARGSDKPFTVGNVGDLLPATSPFLKDLFESLIALHLSPRLGWLIEDLVSLLHRTAVREVFAAESRDPVIHFYEDFLDAYDPTIRAARGVYYTPDEVVQYIVSTTHHLLIEKFGLPLGLADTTSWGEFAERHNVSLPDGVEASEPFVQILDPATGTGTFLKCVIEVIRDTKMREWAGPNWTSNHGENAVTHAAAWSAYVHADLLPRVNGFELIMAPYIVCHLRLGLLLQETGVEFGHDDRLRVFLTNSLDPETMLGEHVAAETAAARAIKVGSGVTTIIGNPPYSKMSGNLSSAAVSLVEPFRYVEGEKIKEKGALAFELNIQDDYVKFWGLALAHLSRARFGIWAAITNSRYLASRSLRGLRSSVTSICNAATFIDLGGQISERVSGAPCDENVFNIAQGVAIAHVLSLPAEGPMTKVGLVRLWGTRADKLQRLSEGEFKTQVQQVKILAPHFRFAASNDEVDGSYSEWPTLAALMPFNSGSIITSRDALAINFEEPRLLENITRFANSRRGDRSLQAEIGFSVKSKWDVEGAKAEIRSDRNPSANIRRILYRPFDWRNVYYSTKLLDTPSKPVCSQIFERDNLVLLAPRVRTTGVFCHVLVADAPAETKACSHDRATQMFPLFRYTEGLLVERVTNLRVDLLTRSPKLRSGFLPEDWFHYIYAVLHSNAYRELYGALEIDEYPRVPGISDELLLAELAAAGKALVACHLLEGRQAATEVGVIGGTVGSLIESVIYDRGSVFLDRGKTAGFVGISEDAWSFAVGGYQVLHKWLKDRKRRIVTEKDAAQYQAIASSITTTIELSQRIDSIIDERGGWPSAFDADGGQSMTRARLTPTGGSP